jgi:hypothetical protein
MKPAAVLLSAVVASLRRARPGAHLYDINTACPVPRSGDGHIANSAL